MHYIRFYYISGYVEEIAKILQKENIEYTIGGDPKLKDRGRFSVLMATIRRHGTVLCLDEGDSLCYTQTG